MIDSQVKLLEENGWEIECESPLEIRHRETGSFATQLSALYVIQVLEQDDSDQA